MELVERFESALRNLGVRYSKKTQYGSTVDAVVFKMTGNRSYGYVLRKDRTNSTGRTNLVFRFKSGDNPRGWFKENEVPETARSWRGRFLRVWSEDTNAPPMFREPARVTDQYGIRVSKEDLNALDFDESLAIYTQIAVTAAEAARRQTNRDWSAYEKLTA